MAIGPRLDLRQSQTLVMTPQLRQAIKLLQFSNVEVSAFIDEELERNPLLERDDRGDPDRVVIGEAPAPDQRPFEAPRPQDDGPLPGEAAFSDPNVRDVGQALTGDNIAVASNALDAEGAETYDPGGAGDGVAIGRGAGQGFEDDDRSIDDFAERSTTLREYLGEQLRLSFADATDRIIGAALIALLEPTGRLAIAPGPLAEALGASVEHVEDVRARMMRFDPTGIFARDLRECLAVQLAEKNRLDPAMQALLDHLELLGKRDMRGLMAVCGVDGEDLADMVAEIKRLDPKPGANWNEAPPLPVVPDILMRPTQDGGWMLELNPETLPRVLINQTFTAKVLPKVSKEDKTFLAEKLATATWLVKSLQQRAQTILKVASEIVRRQDGFFRHGVSHLRPLILRDIADAVEMHESTVSRVTSNKYMATPRGTLELKYFFTTAIAGTAGGEAHSAEAIRHRIRSLVDAETPEDILSDDALVAALRKEGVDIARRTVAKYRDALRIQSSVQRKREKALPG